MTGIGQNLHVRVGEGAPCALCGLAGIEHDVPCAHHHQDGRGHGTERVVRKYREFLRPGPERAERLCHVVEHRGDFGAGQARDPCDGAPPARAFPI